MGACASKPNDLDIRPESLPSEAPASPKTPEGETVDAQENVKDGGVESQKEEALVDISEPKQEAVGKPADAQVVLAEESKPDATSENAIEETVQKPSEEKAKAGEEKTTEPAKEEQQAADVAVTTEKLDATQSSKDKSDPPIVTV